MRQKTDDDKEYRRLGALRRKADGGEFLSKSEELWLGRVIFDSRPWAYPTEQGGDEYRDASEYPARTESQLRHADTARAILYESNKRLVYRRANSYFVRYHHHVPLDECEANGFQGLARALNKYDYRKGFKFSTYAIWWISRDITRGSGCLSRMVDVPDADIQRFTSANRDMRTGVDMKTALAQNHLDADTYRMIRDADAFYESLDTPIGTDDDEGATMMDVIDSDGMGTGADTELDSDPSSSLENEAMMRDLALSISRLPERQRAIISIIYGPDRRSNGRLRPVSDTHAREVLGMSKHEYDILKAEAMATIASDMGEWGRG